MALKKTFDLGDISFGESKTAPADNMTNSVKNNDTSVSTQKEIANDTIYEEKEAVKKETNAETTGVKLITNKKNLKTEHKNFLFDKELADQLKKVSKKTGLSENEVVSQILKQTLSQLLEG